VEYYNRIPMRCGWNAFCQQQSRIRLNSWYQYQSGRVNRWYRSLYEDCSGRRAPGDVGGAEVGNELNTGQIENIPIDDQDTTTRLRIPGTPAGFQPQ